MKRSETMNKIALAERLEGYAQVFASECPIAVDLVAMGKALRQMNDEKFASIINDAYDADEEVEALWVSGPGQRRGPGPSKMTQMGELRTGPGGGRGPAMIADLAQKAQADPEFARKLEELAKSASEDTEEKEAVLTQQTGPGPKYGPGTRPSKSMPSYSGGGKGAKLVSDLAEKAEKDPQFAKKLEELAKSASESNEDETVDAGQNTDIPKAKDEPVGKSWSKSASAAVLQALVRDVTGMNKSICCDTNQKLTKEQMPDAEKKAETPASLKPDQTPDESESLDSNMVAKSKKTPLKKEAGAKKGPGKPDGTGPMSDTEECPKSDKSAQDEEKLEEKHEEKEEEALKEIADGLETAQEGLEKVEKAEVAEKAVDDMQEEEGEEKDAGKKTTEEELAEMKKQKAQELKSQKQKELKKKSRPKKEEKSAGDTVVAEGFEFDATMQDIDINPEEQKKLASLFQ
jgi:hypothetical protein